MSFECYFQRRVSDSLGLKFERMLAGGFGVCPGDRKEYFVTRSERVGRFVCGEKGRQVRRKSVLVCQGFMHVDTKPCADIDDMLFVSAAR